MFCKKIYGQDFIRIAQSSYNLCKSFRTYRIMKSVKLNGTNKEMPTVGLGTWQATDEVIEKTVFTALKLGYRHFDTAFNYNNEEAIGRAIQKWFNEYNGKREDLFITTKLPHVGNRAQDVRRFLQMQLSRLQLEYVDLYLIHVPFGFVCDEQTLTPKVLESGEYELDPTTNHTAIWRALEECQKEGLTKNLGLSNFNSSQIENICKTARLKPQVLQVELHMYFQQLPLRTFCAENNIVVTAYGPLGSPGAKDHFVNKYNYSPDHFPDILSHPEVKEIALEHNKSAAQVLLRYLVQQQVVVIPKSTSEHRLKENMDVFDFELRPADLNRLKKLDRGDDGRIFNFLFWKGVKKHPQYPFKELLANMDKKEIKA